MKYFKTYYFQFAISDEHFGCVQKVRAFSMKEAKKLFYAKYGACTSGTMYTKRYWLRLQSGEKQAIGYKALKELPALIQNDILPLWEE